ncbi:hypothetical protein LWC35_29100 [Pseudonocardia kujensis]|uniref:hypothetical protein n=1 Tax=Pseudonocardia kujensis TaxID=1128675 RepID=UPI001E3698BC|nr:hypothetical protein [Pseudonocardia kujensis]MCE0766934.1 hypothetical protein [Pseudonocardia kujensis]
MGSRHSVERARRSHRPALLLVLLAFAAVAIGAAVTPAFAAGRTAGTPGPAQAAATATPADRADGTPQPGPEDGRKAGGRHAAPAQAAGRQQGTAGIQNGGQQNGAQQNGNQNQNGNQDQNGARNQNGAQKQNTPNPNCTLTVPPAPLTAAGLATPYRLRGTGDGGDCHEANTAQSAFVEATILDPATGSLSVYHPLVIDEGSQPAAAPVPVTLPANAVVGIWFGFQGDALTLRTSPADAQTCVNGLPGSPFGQFADCNGAAFFGAANAAIKAGMLKVPALGTGRDGLPCPTTRDFAVVDQDQSDNLVTRYRATRDGRIAQDSPANTGLGGTVLTNASDNGLLASAVDPALGCTPFTAPDLTAGGAPTPSLALNELQAAADQPAPVATVPLDDPMVKVDDRTSTAKTNLYRAGVDMAPLGAGDPGDGAAYCRNLAAVAPDRLARDRDLLQAAASPDPAAAKTLFGFLTQRLTTSWQNLGCQDLVHAGPPQVAGAPKAQQQDN